MTISLGISMYDCAESKVIIDKLSKIATKVEESDAVDNEVIIYWKDITKEECFRLLDIVWGHELVVDFTLEYSNDDSP